MFYPSVQKLQFACPPADSVAVHLLGTVFLSKTLRAPCFVKSCLHGAFSYTTREQIPKDRA